MIYRVSTISTLCPPAQSKNYFNKKEVLATILGAEWYFNAE